MSDKDKEYLRTAQEIEQAQQKNRTSDEQIDADLDRIFGGSFKEIKEIGYGGLPVRFRGGRSADSLSYALERKDPSMVTPAARCDFGLDSEPLDDKFEALCWAFAEGVIDADVLHRNIRLLPGLEQDHLNGVVITEGSPFEGRKLWV